MSDATRYADLPAPYSMHRGGTLPALRIAYETWGALTAAKDNAVLILTGMSPGAHAAASPENPDPGWWEAMVGPGRPIDTNRYFVICVNSLGSCKGSTGPASINPHTGDRYALDFPELAIEDVADTAYRTVRNLGIERLKAIVGPSMGGMSALAYCIHYPGAVENMLSISAAPTAAPFAIAVRSLQREAIRSDPDWQGGRYDPERLPVNGMRIARKLGVMTYRSAEEWRQRFGRQRLPEGRRDERPFGIEFEVESYLEAHAQRFIGSFDPNCYLYLSRAMDLFDVADYGGSVDAGLARVDVERALVIGVETDFLFPLYQQQEIADGLRRGGCDVQFEALASVQGHDSFLVDMQRFGPVIGQFFDGL